MKLKDLLPITEAKLPTDMTKKSFKDVINGKQVDLVDKTGKRFGSTNEQDNHEIFWTNGRQNRELLKKVGEKAFIKQLKQIYNIKVSEVM